MEMQADSAWNRGDTEAAGRLYRALLHPDSTNTRALHRLGLMEAWDGEYDESLPLFGRLLELEPENPEARLGEARLLAISDRVGTAVHRYQELLRDHPANQEARRGLAQVLTWAGRLPQGESVWRESLDAQPDDPVSRIGLARSLRWQGRNAAALAVLQEAPEEQKTRPDLVEELRWIRSAVAPRAGISIIQEGDSDHNAMTTGQTAGGWNPTPRLILQGAAYGRDLEQSRLGLSRSSWGVSLLTSYQLEPGWSVSLGAGGTRLDGSGPSSFKTIQAGIRSPSRYPLRAGVALSKAPLDVTAPLVERGVDVDLLDVSAFWIPSPRWEVTLSGGAGIFRGEEENRRTYATVRVEAPMGRGLAMGLSHRYFGFQKDLDEDYFDPDRFGLTEVTGSWRLERGPWGLRLELAPGLQKIGSHETSKGAARGSARLRFRVAPGRDVSVTGGYSSAGLQSFSSGRSDYRYRALTVSAGWAFY